MRDPLHGDAPEADIVDIDVQAWVAASRADPVLYRARQVTEIVLTSIGLSPTLRTSLVLKGGALMALAFDSVRMTGDVDFTADVEPEGFAERFAAELNELMPKTALRLGYLDLRCRVQKIDKKPRAEAFEDHQFPALLVRVASARRGAEERRFDAGRAVHVVDIEISFRDQVYTSQTLKLTDAGVAVRAFTVHETIAEKYRALLQQPVRNRYRRQDVYDVAHLVQTHAFDREDQALILEVLVQKCRSRGIEPNQASIRNPEVVRRAEADWATLKLEVEDLPEFAPRYDLIADFYEALPWPQSS